MDKAKLTAAKIRQGWKADLAAQGFRPQGSLFIRQKGILLQVIGIQRNFLSPTWKVNISVCIEDEFLEKRNPHVCLSGNVAPEGARCYVDKESWWREEQIPSQLDAILKFGIPWLDDFAEPAKLVHLLETAIEQCTSVATLLEPKLREEYARPSFLKSMHIPGKSVVPVPAQPAPNHFYLLSLLYQATGNLEKGCDRAMIWLALVSKWKSQPNGEPARTLRHLAAMGCKCKGPDTQD